MTNRTCIAFLITIGCLIVSCGSSKKVVKEPSSGEIEKYQVSMDSVLPCDHHATMVLDLEDASCGILLRMKNGLHFQPLELPDPNFTFSSGDRVRVSFEIQENYRSDCAKAQKIIKISCLEKDWNLSYDKSDECINTIDAFSIPWMKRLIGEMDPEKITKYDFQDRLAYKFEGKKGTVIVDCHGSELCRRRPGEEDGCRQVQGQLSNAYVILVVNNDEKR